MKPVSRVNITDPILLRRLEVARERLKDSTTTKTASRIIEDGLQRMGIPTTDAAVEPPSGTEPKGTNPSFAA